MYCDKNGILTNTPQRKYFSIIDGIIGQQGQGPSMGDPLYTCLLLAGRDPVAVDTVAALVMGFDKDKIKVIRNTESIAHRLGTCDLDRICIRSNVSRQPAYNFAPPNGWEILINKED